MGTELEIEVEAPSRKSALLASEAAVRALGTAEARLSTWTAGSELSRLNEYPAGQTFPLSEALAAELAAVRQCWLETGGAFDPSVGALVVAWGLRSGGRVPSATELEEARRNTSFDQLELPPRAARRRHEGLRIEEGAWGKGAGLDRALAAVSSVAPEARVVLNLGGQVAMSTNTPTRVVSLADPDQRERPVLEVEVLAGSIATSGNSEHGFEAEGTRYSHLLDPRTGWPAPDFGSMAVLAPSALQADCLSTGLFVMGPGEAFAWASAHPPVELIVIERISAGLRVWITPGLEQRVRRLTQDVSVEVVRSGDGRPKSAAEAEESWQSPASAAMNPPGY